jgi:tRNA threonylcarbamoyladenosine biosynthesis protein TsaE
MNTILKNSPIVSSSEEETENIAAQLAKTTPIGSVIALHGDLGAGKTVFSRGFARGLGVKEPVSSPTYTIIQEYQLASGWFFHLDLYRINDENAALAFGVNEYLEDTLAWAVVEWPERIAGILPEHTIHLQIKHLDSGHREICRIATPVI